MSRLLFAGMALVALAASCASRAADLPATIPMAPGPVYDWSGFYAGAHLGGALDSRATAVSGTTGGSGTLATEASGFAAGGQVGFDYALTPHWVAGLEADFSGAGLKSSAQLTTATTTEVQKDNGIDLFGTIRGRVGYAVNTWLIYGTGGFGWAGEQLSRTQLAGTTGTAVPGTVETAWETGFGWAAGAGMEWAFSHYWTLRVEYLHLDLGTASFLFPQAGERYQVTGTVDTVRIGFNYMFDLSQPLPVRY